MQNLNFRVPANFKDLKAFNNFLKKVKKKYAGMGVEVGVVKNSTGVWKYGPKKGKAKDITVAEEAFYNCKGVPEKNIPPRDYQQFTIDENMAKWRKQIKNDLKQMSSLQVCKRIGIVARDATKATISEGKMLPTNADITKYGGWMHKNGKSFYVAGKGDKPTLVDNGDLQKSITYQVIGQDGKEK